MMRLTGASSVQHADMPDDQMDLDESVQSRQSDGQDQVVVDAMDLCERVAQPYDARGFFLNLPANVLRCCLTFMTMTSFRNLSETSKESHQRLMDLFHFYTGLIDSLSPRYLGRRFILENLDRDQKEIKERLTVFEVARVFIGDMLCATKMTTKNEIRDALSYGLFEGSLYRFSLHLLSLIKAFEDYNRTALAAPDQKNQRLKWMLETYVSDKKSILEAVEKGVDEVEQISAQGIVVPPEFAELRALPKLWFQIINWRYPLQCILYTFVYLKELNLEGEIYELLPEIRNLKQLEVLEVRKKLKSLPSEIGELSSLKELYLMDNKSLATLPDSITQLKLNVFDIRDSGIRLTHLSKEVREWTKGISEFKIQVPDHVRFVRQYPTNAAPF